MSQHTLKLISIQLYYPVQYTKGRNNPVQYMTGIIPYSVAWLNVPAHSKIKSHNSSYINRDMVVNRHRNKAPKPYINAWLASTPLKLNYIIPVDQHNSKMKLTHSSHS
jgi:hypothetical protein